MTIPPRAGLLGVVGGLGPIASAEFLRTIYEYSAGRAEQTMPAVIVSSDPAVPDRTQALVNGTSAVLLECLSASVRQLLDLHCSHVVVCCVTMHAVFPRLPRVLRDRIISLIDVAIDQIRARGERQLLFCSSGSRAVRVFEQHPRWEDVAHLVLLPEPRDQETIHQFIYAIKRTGRAGRHLRPTGALLEKYGVQSLMAGCTEFHLLTKAARRRAAPWRTCDPLDCIAQAWAQAVVSEEAAQ
jgi:aspartate racemase